MFDFFCTPYVQDHRKISCPLALDLSKYRSHGSGDTGSPKYDAIATIHHIGAATNVGHYTACTRSCQDPSCWIVHDDEKVCRRPAPDVASNTVYIAFYQRRLSSGPQEASSAVGWYPQTLLLDVTQGSWHQVDMYLCAKTPWHNNLVALCVRPSKVRFDCNCSMQVLRIFMQTWQA